MDVDKDKSIEELTTEEFKSVVNKISVQFSYSMNPIGRVHIRQTGEYITGLMIDDDKEFYWENCPSMETDLIMKAAIELIRYCRGDSNELNKIPIYVKTDDEDYLRFLSSIINIPYGKVVNVRKLKYFKFKYKKSLKDLELMILIPTHRLKSIGINEYHFHKLLSLEKDS